MYTKQVIRDRNGKVIKQIYTTADYKPTTPTRSVPTGTGSEQKRAQDEQLFWMTTDLKLLNLLLKLKKFVREQRGY